MLRRYPAGPPGDAAVGCRARPGSPAEARRAMSHCISALVARAEALRAATAHLAEARVAALPQGFGLLPLTPALREEIGDDTELPAPWDALYGLTPGVIRLAESLSAGAAVAYVETDYFGGNGDQGAAAWEGGRCVVAPERGRRGIVNRALRRIGVVAGRREDEFEASGLPLHRRTDDWFETAEAADAGSSGRDGCGPEGGVSAPAGGSRGKRDSPLLRAARRLLGRTHSRPA